MKLLMRLVSVLILLASVAAALGYVMPERFGFLGVLGVVVLIPTTVLLGIVHLIRTRRNQKKNVR